MRMLCIYTPHEMPANRGVRAGRAPACSRWLLTVRKQNGGTPNLPLGDLEAHARAEWRRLAAGSETGADLADPVRKRVIG
jgi:hypothetical protein